MKIKKRKERKKEIEIMKIKKREERKKKEKRK